VGGKKKTLGVATTNYKLEELAREGGTSPRTVRYYVQRGLLPAPAFKGKDTGYAHEHLVRLRAIKRLQEAYFPLDAIAGELASRSLADIERIADGRLVPSSHDMHGPPSPHSPYRSYSSSSDREHELVVTETRSTRFTIAPGVAITLDDDAPAESRRVVMDLLASLQATSRIREGR